MPLSIVQATNVIKKEFPNGRIQAVITYKGLYLFQVFRDDLLFEEELDPFYSVDQQTGVVKDFSIITDGDMTEIMSLFIETKNKKK